MKNKIRDFFYGIITFFSVAVILYLIYICTAYATVYVSAKKIDAFESYEYLRIKLYGSTQTPDGNTVSATFSIVDSNLNEIAVIERSWSGSYLAVEFDIFSMKDKQFIFPGKIYGKNHIFETKFNRKKVTNLEKYYNENKQCMLYGYGTTYTQRHLLYNIATFATKTTLFPIPDFGFTNKYILDLSNCVNDKYYSVTKVPDGKLMLQEL